jgi:flagellar biosynthesis/type III secretory pathway M-ring protein FliF/YscJ
LLKTQKKRGLLHQRKQEETLNAQQNQYNVFYIILFFIFYFLFFIFYFIINYF